jgi:hypothetical protein
MSDHKSHETASAPSDASLFTAVEVEQFGADDVKAGGDIGKMLSALFLYTVIAMSIAGWWTWSSIREAQAKHSAPDASDSHEHGESHDSADSPAMTEPKAE